jgi:hypothetical protein
MKRLLGVLGVLALAVCLPIGAVAGDFHTGATLVCSDCHVMHFSQQHGYNADGTGNFTALGGTAQHYLLRNEVNDLCLTCHNGSSFAPDVLGSNANSYVREAGALNRPSHGEGLGTTGHTLDSTDPAPGSNPEWSAEDGLECANCHFPHGSATGYRNLAGNPGNYSTQSRSYANVTYATGTNDLTKDVYQIAAGPMATHYSVDNVFYNEPAAPTKAESAYAFYCKGCHTDFHGDKGGTEMGGATGEEWLRHPSSNANIGGLTGGHSSLTTFTSRVNKVKVMSASGTYPAADNTPSCFSCHKSHGNQNAFGLVFMSGTGAVDEEGDDGTTVKQMCKQCHVQG